MLLAALKPYGLAESPRELSDEEIYRDFCDGRSMEDAPFVAQELARRRGIATSKSF